MSHPQGGIEFPISSQGLGHVKLNLGYLAKSAKCRVYALEHGLSNADKTRNNLDPHPRSRSRSLDFSIYEMWPYAKSIGFDSLNGIDLRFQSYECPHKVRQ